MRTILILAFSMLVGTAAAYACSYSNPYPLGSGHHAGFEWAEKHDVDSCGGNNRSFIEGCEEYLRQKRDCE